MWWPRRERRIVVALFVVGAFVRVLVGVRRPTPLYYPDEYIYSALARSVADGGLPRIRGALHFPSFLAPYLMAPAWLIDDVSTAYHVAVAAGAIWFSAAVFPAYALARRVGVSPAGGIVVALLAAVVPDAAFASAELTEPYAYPLFLATVLVVVDAIVWPTRRRQIFAFALIAALCLLRVQFAVLPFAWLVAALVREGRSPSRTWRAHPAIIGAALVGVVGLFIGARFYTGLFSHWSAVASMGPWIGIDVFVLSVAAGWAIVPGGVIGLVGLVRSSSSWQRTFAAFSISAATLIVLEAAYFDAIQHRIHERYTFYAAPLLAVACLWALERGLAGRRYAVVAYVLAIAAVAIPATSTFAGASPGQAPTVLGLETLGTGNTARLLWALGLAAAAVIVAQLRDRPWFAVGLGVLIAAALCAGATRALLRYAPIARPGGAHDISLYRLDAPPHSALVTWGGTNEFVLMKTLFWTRNVDRVLVVGGGPAGDGYPSQPVYQGDAGLVDRSGRAVKGPFAFPLDTTAVSDGVRPAWDRRLPPAIFLGLVRHDRYLSIGSRLVVPRSRVRRTVRLVLVSSKGRKTLTFDCGSQKFQVPVGASPVPVRIHVPPNAAQNCRASLTGGDAVEVDGSIVSGVRVLRFRVDRGADS